MPRLVSCISFLHLFYSFGVFFISTHECVCASIQFDLNPCSLQYPTFPYPFQYLKKTRCSRFTPTIYPIHRLLLLSFSTLSTVEDCSCWFHFPLSWLPVNSMHERSAHYVVLFFLICSSNHVGQLLFAPCWGGYSTAHVQPNGNNDKV